MSIRNHDSHPIGAHLHMQYQRCVGPHRHDAIIRRWVTDPALAGLRIDDIIKLCSQATVDQNPVIAALLRLHQHGDIDATTVLLIVLHPIAVKVAVSSHGGDRDHLSTIWAAVAHLLATVDPDADTTDADGDQRPFLAYLASRLRASRRALDPGGRSQTHRQTITCLDPLRINGEISDPQIPDVADHALVLVELGRLANAVTTGQIRRDRWQQLVEHRVHERAASSTDRVRTMRTSRRLAHLVNHAA